MRLRNQLTIFFSPDLRDLDFRAAACFSRTHVESLAGPHTISLHSANYSDCIDRYVYCNVFSEVYVYIKYKKHSTECFVLFLYFQGVCIPLSLLHSKDTSISANPSAETL